MILDGAKKRKNTETRESRPHSPVWWEHSRHPPLPTEKHLSRIHQKIAMDRKVHNAKSADPHLLVLQAVKDNLAAAVVYRAYRLFNRFHVTMKRSPAISPSWLGMVDRRRKRTPATRRTQVAIIWFLATFKLASDTNHVLEEAAIRWYLTAYMRRPPLHLIAMCTPNILGHCFPLRCVIENRDCGNDYSHFRKWSIISWQSLPRIKIVTEYDASIVRYMKPLGLTPHQYADCIIATSCKVADLYDKSTLNDVSIQMVNSSFRRNLRNVWVTLTQVDLIETVS